MTRIDYSVLPRDIGVAAAVVSSPHLSISPERREEMLSELVKPYADLSPDDRRARIRKTVSGLDGASVNAAIAAMNGRAAGLKVKFSDYRDLFPSPVTPTAQPSPAIAPTMRVPVASAPAVPREPPARPDGELNDTLALVRSCGLPGFNSPSAEDAETVRGMISAADAAADADDKVAEILALVREVGVRGFTASTEELDINTYSTVVWCDLRQQTDSVDARRDTDA